MSINRALSFSFIPSPEYEELLEKVKKIVTSKKFIERGNMYLDIHKKLSQEYLTNLNANPTGIHGE